MVWRSLSTLRFRLICETGFLAVFDRNNEDGVALETVMEDITGNAGLRRQARPLFNIAVPAIFSGQPPDLRFPPRSD